jgi:hypothetical protein
LRYGSDTDTHSEAKGENSAMTSHSKIANLRGNGQYGFAVVGESSHQDELEELAGGRTEESAEYYCDAELIPEPDNAFDDNAVFVSVSGEKVGYLPRKTAARYNEARIAHGIDLAICAAVIVGGWDRGEDDYGHFGIKLDVVQPFHFENIRQRPMIASAAAAPARIMVDRAAAIRAGRQQRWGRHARAIVAVACAAAAAWYVASLLVTEQTPATDSLATAVQSQEPETAAIVQRTFADVPLPRPRPNRAPPP